MLKSNQFLLSSIKNDIQIREYPKTVFNCVLWSLCRLNALNWLYRKLHFKNLLLVSIENTKGAKKHSILQIKGL